MLQKILKTTTGLITVSIPEGLDEVTLGQLIGLQSAENLSDLEAISILSGIPLAELQNVKDMADLQLFNTHIVDLSAAIKSLYNSNSMPKRVSFRINGRHKTVQVASNLGIEPAGAFFAARDVITDEINDHIARYGGDNWREQFNPSLRSCALILAHYLYCPATGERYSEYGAEQFVEQVKQLPFTDALPIAKYFFFELSKLIETENKLLASHTTLLEEKAGIKSFQKFGYVNTVNSLAGGDITKWPDVLNIPYNLILTKLMLNQAEANYQKRYTELLQSQH